MKKESGNIFKTAKQRAAEEGFGGSELPDGKYKARLSECSVGVAQTSGRKQVIFKFAVVAGEYKGETVGKYQAYETEDDLVWLNRDLKRFGVEGPESEEELKEIVELLDESKPELVISLKTKDSGQFCYIDKVTSEINAGEYKAEDSEEETEEEAESEEESEEEESPKKKLKGKHEDEEEEAEEEEPSNEVEIDVGMEVKFTTESGKKLSGKIIKVIGDDSVKVKTPKGNIHVVDLDSIKLPEAEEEEEEKPKVKKAKR